MKIRIVKILIVTSQITLFSCEIKEDITETLKISKEIKKANEKLDEDIEKAEELINNPEPPQFTIDTSFVFKPNTPINHNSLTLTK